MQGNDIAVERLPWKLAAKIRADEPTGCWLWLGNIDPDGYGRVKWPVGTGRQPMAHRAVYELLKEPIPFGFVLDHLCGVRACVFPVHMEVVTPAENSRRVVYQPNLNNGQCGKRLHPWTPANIYTDPAGVQHCRKCKDTLGQKRRKVGDHRRARPAPGQPPLFGS